MSNIDIEDIPVFVLCGGLGTRLGEETETHPKPMIHIGNRPILWHIMQYYAKYGFRRFILCLGHKAESIKLYFLNYASLVNDFTIELKTNKINIGSTNNSADWIVTLVFTGELTMTGARVALAASKYLGNTENFALTYGDGLTNANLRSEFEFHLSHGKIGTVLGVTLKSRFGELKHKNNNIIKFQEKPNFEDRWINGGYFFFRKEFLSYLSIDENCVLEQQPLSELASDGQLNMYKHGGFWACMDTPRDRDYLMQLWASGKAPWAI